MYIEIRLSDCPHLCGWVLFQSDQGEKQVCQQSHNMLLFILEEAIFTPLDAMHWGQMMELVRLNREKQGVSNAN